MSDVEDFLAHYGIKGMKWGVRRSRDELARLAGRAPRTRRDEIARRQRQNLSDRRRSLADKDLKEAVERLKTERQLKNLVDEDLRPGRTAVERIMNDSGQKVAKTAITGLGMYGAKVLIEKKFPDAVPWIKKPNK